MAGFPRHMYTFLLDETEPGFRLTDEQTAAVLGFRLRRDIEVPNHEMMYGWRCAAHFRTGKGDWGVTMRKGVTICTPATRKARVRKVLCEEDSTSCDKSFVVSDMLDIGMRMYIDNFNQQGRGDFHLQIEDMQCEGDEAEA